MHTTFFEIFFKYNYIPYIFEVSDENVQDTMRNQFKNLYNYDNLVIDNFFKLICLILTTKHDNVFATIDMIEEREITYSKLIENNYFLNKLLRDSYNYNDTRNILSKDMANNIILHGSFISLLLHVGLFYTTSIIIIIEKIILNNSAIPENCNYKITIGLMREIISLLDSGINNWVYFFFKF